MRLERFAIDGGAYALRRYYNTKLAKPQIEALLGHRGTSPDNSMTRAELEAQMKFLVNDCLRSGDWSAQTFDSYGLYLNSDKGPEDLARLRAAGSAASMYQAAAVVTVGKSPTAAPERDLFAEKYRAAGAKFRALVQASLADGARQAELRGGGLGKPRPKNPPTSVDVPVVADSLAWASPKSGEATLSKF